MTPEEKARAKIDAMLLASGWAVLNDRQRLIIAVLKSKGSFKALKLAEALGGGVTDRTIRNDLLKLVERGWIAKRGQGPSTTYALVEKESKQ